MHLTESNPTAAGAASPELRRKQCRSLVAATHAALHRMGLNKRHWLVLGVIIDATLVRGSTWALLRNESQLGELLGFSKGDLSETLKGYSPKPNVWVKGLLELGIVKFTVVPEGTVVELNPDYSRWDWPEMHSKAQRRAWLAAVAAQSRELERQVLAAEVEQRFDLAALLSDVNLENALRLADEERDPVGAASSHPAGERLTAASGVPAGVARCPRAGRGSDALRAAPRDALRPGAAVSSENPNSQVPDGAREFGKSEPSRARVAIGNKFVTKPCNNIASLSSDELKVKLEGDEDDFCQAARQIMGSDWDDGRAYYFKGEGAAWRLRWRFAPARPVCVRVFLDLISTGKTGGKSAYNCWLDFGGAALDAARFAAAKKLNNFFKPVD